MANEKVAHQGVVVEVPDKTIEGAEAVVQEGQGLVFRTEGNRFGTLGADGFYHGYVPSTQVRDILMGQGENVDDEPVTAMDQAIDKAHELGAEPVAGSEAPFPTGDIEGKTDAVVGPNIAEGNVGAKDELTTDRDPTMAPATKAELDELSGKQGKKS